VNLTDLGLAILHPVLFGKHLATRARTSPPPSDDFWYRTPAQPTQAGVDVNEYNSLGNSAVFNAIVIIAQTIGSLPLHLFRRNGENKGTLATDHPLYDVLHSQANPFMSAMAARETAGNHMVSWGNSYQEKVRDGAGRIRELWPMTPNRVKVEVQAGQPVYVITINNQEIRLTRDQVLHIPGLGFDGLMGYSVLKMARESIAMGLATEQFGARFFGEGTHPSAVVEHPQALGQETHDRLKDSLANAYSGLGKSHRLLILEEGMVMKPISVPPEDAQFLQTREFNVVEIARWFNLNPYKLKDLSRATFSNIEHAAIDHVVDSIRPWLERIEQNYDYQLLTPADRAAGLYTKHSVEGLLRGDSVSRADFYMKLFGIGAISPNEIRALEDLNPYDGGDQYFVPLNYQTVEMAVAPPEPIPVQLQPGDEEPEEDEDRQRLIEHQQYFLESEERTVAGRDRTQRMFAPVILQAARQIVSKETIQVKRQVNKLLKQRQNVEMAAWLDTFYQAQPAEIKTAIGPAFRSFAEAIQAQAALEVGAEVGLTPKLEQWIAGYIDDYAVRHSASSHGQLAKLLQAEGGELEDLETRVDEWHQTRPEKIAANEGVRLSNAMAATVFWGAGFVTVWRIRGPSTCPYCTSLNGKRVSSGGTFQEPGNIILKGQVPMKIRTLVNNPPLHAACDCYVSPG